MTTPFRIGPQQIPGGELSKVLAVVNKNIRDLRRDVVRLPVVIDIPENINSTFGTTSRMALISTTVTGGLISPPARGIRLEAYGQIQNHTGATATFEIEAVFGGTTASVITATLDDVGASSTVRHLNYALDITRGRTIIEAASAGREGVRFDGTYDYAKISNISTAGDSPRGIASLWFKRKAISSGQRIWTTMVPSTLSQFFIVDFDSADNSIRVRGLDGGGSTILDGRTAAITDTGSWHHILIGWDLSTTLTLDMYLDDARTSSTVTTASLVTGSINHSDGTFAQYIGAYEPAAGATDLLNAEVSEFYFNQTEFLDFTQVANRRLFNDGAGAPVYLGASGQTPTGNAPSVYAPSGNPTVNKGHGGGFTVYGELDAVAGPTPASSGDTGQIYRAQVQISNATLNAAQPGEDTLIDKKTFYNATSVPDLETDLVLTISGKNSAASPATGIDFFRARVDLV